MDALGIKIEPTAGDATNSGFEQVFSFIFRSPTGGIKKLIFIKNNKKI